MTSEQRAHTARMGRAIAEAPVAELVGVTKRYGKTLALNRLDLHVAPGELLAVLGPNGAGKSTAVSLWLGMQRSDGGRVSVFGRAPTNLLSRLAVGVMLQDVNLAPELRPREILTLACSYYRDPLTVEETLVLTQTSALADKRYGKLSTGQKRQVQFAVAVCGRPRLLFLDEPSVGLDVEARHTMWRTIRTLLDGGSSIVLTTHYLEEAEALADRVAVLVAGKLVALASPQDMRSVITRTRISCESTLDVAELRSWPGVSEVVRNDRELEIATFDPESILRRLLGADPALRRLQVARATLAEAFTELTKEAA